MKNEGISIVVHNSLSTLEDNPWRQRTEMLEFELAVKWFALTAHKEGKLAGFMHLIRHPERDYEWYCCDVHAIDPYKRQGIATAIYQKASEHLLQYGKACRMTASVSSANLPSVKLHEKLGFFNTQEAPRFIDLNFGSDETIYEHYFAKEYPARNLPIHREILSKIARDDNCDIQYCFALPQKSRFMVFSAARNLPRNMWESTLTGMKNFFRDGTH